MFKQVFSQFIRDNAAEVRYRESASPCTLQGPFDVELEKAELCERERQGVGAAKMDWGSIQKDKDVPKRYHMSGRGSFNYNTSDDLAVSGRRREFEYRLQQGAFYSCPSWRKRTSSAGLGPLSSGREKVS